MNEVDTCVIGHVEYWSCYDLFGLCYTAKLNNYLSLSYLVEHNFETPSQRNVNALCLSRGKNFIQ